MSSSWERFNRDLEISVNADQTEFMAALRGSAPLDAGIQDNRIADNMEEFVGADAQELQPWAETDAQCDNAISALATELQRRSALLKDLYPFSLKNGSLHYVKSNTFVYEFCLAVSCARLSGKKFIRLTNAFERLARDVTRCFLGEGAQALRTGWPPDDFEERSSYFREVCSEIHKQTGEWVWAERTGLPGNPRHIHVKDEGVDFVVWKLMPDRRRGNLFILGQCACGRTDWANKFHDLSIEALKERWFRPLSVAAPLRAFVTPHHIPNDMHFELVNVEAGLTLDRVRITLLAEDSRHREFIKKHMMESYQILTETVIKPVGVDEPKKPQPQQKEVEEPRSQSQGSDPAPSETEKPQVQETPAKPHTPSS